jgi:hypothetical protein
MTTFNPPYEMNVNFDGDMAKEPTTTFTDKDGNVVEKQEVIDYGNSLAVEAPSGDSIPQI